MAGRQFDTTHWSVVLASAEGDTPRAREALARLCETYWYPLYAFVRRQGYDRDDALDLTQGFFLRLVERHYLDSVDPAKGRFRDFLLASLKHYLSSERARARTQKRAPKLPLVSIDAHEAEQRYRVEPADAVTPEEVFERRWALVVIEQVLAKLAQEEVAAGNGRQYEKLHPHLTSGAQKGAYKKVAEELGMGEGALRVSVHRLRRRFGRLLRQEVAHTVDDPGKVDDEIRSLLSLVGRAGGVSG